jgi:KaiC/GvpD/RAD55 family RecA-like ATPase
MGDIERMKTGIKGLDELLHGGIPKGAVILISGSPGSGKSVLSMQILINGCKMGEKCLYVSFEQPVEDVIKQAKTFGWEVEKYSRKGAAKNSEL